MADDGEGTSNVDKLMKENETPTSANNDERHGLNGEEVRMVYCCNLGVFFHTYLIFVGFLLKKDHTFDHHKTFTKIQTKHELSKTIEKMHLSHCRQ